MAKKKQLRYYVITNSDISAFEKEVNDHLNEGCQLAGGVSTSSFDFRDSTQIQYAQAVLVPV